VLIDQLPVYADMCSTAFLPDRIAGKHNAFAVTMTTTTKKNNNDSNHYYYYYCYYYYYYQGQF